MENFLQRLSLTQLISTSLDAAIPAGHDSHLLLTNAILLELVACKTKFLSSAALQ